MIDALKFVEEHPGLAAWMQAILSFVAILAAAWIARRQFTWQLMEERKRQDQRDAEDTRRMACVLAAELSGIIARVEHVSIPKAYRETADMFSRGQTPSVLPTFDAQQTYTVIYDRAGDRIAHLGGDLPRRIVALYTQIKGIIDTLNNHVQLVKEVTARLHANPNVVTNHMAAELLKRLAPSLRMFADEIDSAIQAAKPLVAELEAVAASTE